MYTCTNTAAFFGVSSNDITVASTEDIIDKTKWRQVATIKKYC